MRLLESGEMYLETILILSKESSYVRAIDVSEYMGYSKPSVSRALGVLKEGGYITVEAGGAIRFTDRGRAVAEKIYERHNVLTELFERMGVGPLTAEEDACRIEHVISDETFERVKDFLKKEKA